MSNHIISAGNGFSWQLDAVTVTGKNSFESGGWLSDAQGQVNDAVGLMGGINSVSTSNFGFENSKSALDIGGGFMELLKKRLLRVINGSVKMGDIIIIHGEEISIPEVVQVHIKQLVCISGRVGRLLLPLCSLVVWKHTEDTRWTVDNLVTMPKKL